MSQSSITIRYEPRHVETDCMIFFVVIPKRMLGHDSDYEILSLKTTVCNSIIMIMSIADFKQMKTPKRSCTSRIGHFLVLLPQNWLFDVMWVIIWRHMTSCHTMTSHHRPYHSDGTRHLSIVLLNKYTMKFYLVTLTLPSKPWYDNDIDLIIPDLAWHDSNRTTHLKLYNWLKLRIQAPPVMQTLTGMFLDISVNPQLIKYLPFLSNVKKTQTL